MNIASDHLKAGDRLRSSDRLRLRQIADELGEEMARMLIGGFGGTRLYIPLRPMMRVRWFARSAATRRVRWAAASAVRRSMCRYTRCAPIGAATGPRF